MDHLNIKLLIFVDILQVLRFHCQKFRILEILNFFGQKRVKLYCLTRWCLTTISPERGKETVAVTSDPDVCRCFFRNELPLRERLYTQVIQIQ